MPYTIPNYAPNVKPGDIRRRIWRNENENSLSGIPCARMYEEDAVLVEEEGGLVERSFGNHPPPLTHIPVNPDEVVELRNIADDTLLGQTTLGMIHTMIYSLGRHMQKLRDWSELRRINGGEIQGDIGVATDALGAAMSASTVAESEATRLEGVAAETPEGPERVTAEAIATAARAEATRLADDVTVKAAEVVRLTAEFQALITATGG